MTVTVTVKETRRERDTRIEDTPAVPNEPTDHAVARGRDVSLRYEGGHSQENHTVVLEWCRSGVGDHRRTAAATNVSDQSSQSAEHVVVKCTAEGREHQPGANDHEGRNAK